MIIINGEHGFQVIESWNDIEQAPGFELSIDPKQHVLKSIIGQYRFLDSISCGLKGCKRSHLSGYLVQTEKGAVTNIGHICGKIHFNVDFEEHAKVFRRALKDHNNRLAITSFLFQADAHLSNLLDLRSATLSADWVYKSSQCLVKRDRSVPDRITSQINTMVRGRSGVIVVDVEVEEEVIRAREVSTGNKLPRPQYDQVSRGVIEGIECLYPENDIRTIMVVDLIENLTTLLEHEVEKMSSIDLSRWAKWCNEYDNKRERLQVSYNKGLLLLTRTNLQQLSCLLDSPKTRKEYKKWLNTTLPK